jgi:hypothetical protein
MSNSPSARLWAIQESQSIVGGISSVKRPKSREEKTISLNQINYKTGESNTMKSATSFLKRLVIVFAVVIGIVVQFSPAPAQAGIVDQITKVYDSAKSGGKQYFCRKQDVTSGTFSVRSYEGELCSNSRAIAGLSQYVCLNPEVAGFKNSQCDVKGKKKLDGADPLTVVKEEARSATGSLLSLIKLFVPL